MTTKTGKQEFNKNVGRLTSEEMNKTESEIPSNGTDQRSNLSLTLGTAALPDFHSHSKKHDLAVFIFGERHS